MKHLNSYFVIPAYQYLACPSKRLLKQLGLMPEAGIQAGWRSRILIEDKNVNFHLNWIPAYAGMTAEK